MTPTDVLDEAVRSFRLPVDTPRPPLTQLYLALPTVDDALGASID